MRVVLATKSFRTWLPSPGVEWERYPIIDDEVKVARARLA